MTTARDFLALKDRATHLLGPSPMWARAAPRVLQELGGDTARLRSATDVELAFILGKVAARVDGARRAGRVRSPAKALASRRNGLRGGRPRDRAPAPRRR